MAARCQTERHFTPTSSPGANANPVIFDAEPNLSAGLSAHPTYIKPNKDELEGLVGHSLKPLSIHHAGRQIYEQYGMPHHYAWR
jgi:fructose-1-phosphate kinase PfkB-like protein